MSEAIGYRTGTASVNDLLLHLHDVNSDFIPPLSSRIDIDKYAAKLKANACLCEAWSSGILVGLVAGYCNDSDEKIGFITSVSVLKRCSLRGIGEHLVNQFLALARQTGMTRVCLEVSARQQSATKLYHKLGFQLQSIRGDTQLMAINLSETTNDQHA